MIARFLLIAIAAAHLPACSESRSQRCREVCEVEALCFEERKEREERERREDGEGGESFRFDRGECIAVCETLERDDEGRALVEEHAACVQEAAKNPARPDCDAVLACR